MNSSRYWLKVAIVFFIVMGFSQVIAQESTEAPTPEETTLLRCVSKLCSKCA